MSSSNKISASRVLHASTARSLRQAPVLSTLILRSPAICNRPCPSSSTRYLNRRDFWWGRNGYRSKSCSYNADYHKNLESQQRVTKLKSFKAILRSSPWQSHHPLYQYCPGQGWRLSSSWGKPEGKWPNADQPPKEKSKGEEEKHNDWRSEYHKRQDEIAKRFEELKRRVEEDPFGVLFGRRLDRGAWNPWGPLNWGLARKVEIEKTGSEKQTLDANTSRLQKDDVPLPTAKGEENSSQSQERTTPRIKVQPPNDPAAASKSGAPNGYHSSPIAPFSMLESSEDYDIDPISMRKVPRRSSDRVDTESRNNKDAGINIPVKIFVEHKVNPGAFSDKVTPLSTPENGSSKRTTSTSSGKADSSFSSAEDWLAQEGFRFRKQQVKVSEPMEKVIRQPDITTAPFQIKRPKIESSLDRHIRTSEANLAPTVEESRPLLQYNAEENKAEDVDLLRASDVRAASGIPRRPQKESEEEKQVRRKKLEQDFEKRPQDLETKYAEELAAQKAKDVVEKHKIVDSSYLNEISDQESPAANVDAFGYDLSPQGLETSYQREVDTRQQTTVIVDGRRRRLPAVRFGRQDHLKSHQASIVEKMTARKAAESMAELDGFDRIPQGLQTSLAREQQEKQRAVAAALAEEINTQKAAMAAFESSKSEGLTVSRVPSSVHLGEGDMPSNVPEFAERDRWYKKKAPHATERESRSRVERQEQQSRDRALVREVRGIYEDTYGTIDTKHRQAGSAAFMEGKEDAAVQQGLQEYDSKYGERVGSFRPLQTGLKAEYMKGEENEVHPKPAMESRRHEYTGKELEEKQDSSASTSPPPLDVTSPPPSTIDPLSTPPSSEPLTAPKTNTYKIIAYDESTQDVRMATLSAASSMFETQTPTSPSEVLFNLSHPAKFLPHFSALQKAGFDLISGSGDVLVFKQVREAIRTTAVAPEKDQELKGDEQEKTGKPKDIPRAMNPIDGTTTQTGNFASPTGFVNLDNVIYPPPLSRPLHATPRPPVGTSNSADKVRREEDVFSGSPRSRWQEEEEGEGGATEAGRAQSRTKGKGKGKVRKTVKRVFWVGLWTAGCCYAVGVVAEFFRTGGEGGRGAVGF
ncbi:hypothetical protein MMC24_001562 [Lignoscripta atroalba]|nr:hypothetical protein [Lignoscripta atroalba]